MAKPSRTINPLHFEDLDPRRFEDLAMALVYQARQWEDVHHDGRLGSDDGVDIRAIEKLADGSLRHWFVQCKRYKAFGAADAKKAVDEALAKAKTSPGALLLVVGCDMTLAARSEYETYAAAKGLETAMVWTSSKLEAMLYADHPDLLFAYFGVSLAHRERRRETDLRRSLILKRKLAKLVPPPPKKYTPRVLIRSIDDESYPDTSEPDDGKISGWFRLEFAGLYYNGFESYHRVVHIICDRTNGDWAEPHYADPDVKAAGSLEAAVDLGRYEVVKCFSMSRIPFRNIVEIDEDGDEYYTEWHIFCKFANGGEPYEALFFREINGYREFHLDKQFPFADRYPRR